MINRVRERRLESDFIAAQAVVLASRQRILIEESFGSPPESYHFLFRCRCVSKLTSDSVLYGEEHRVSIKIFLRISCATSLCHHADACRSSPHLAKWNTLPGKLEARREIGQLTATYRSNSYV